MVGLLVNLLLAVLVAAAQTAPLQTPGHVTGRIVDAGTGEPIANAFVSVAWFPVVPQSARGVSVPPRPDPIAPLRTETNANGAFEITGIPPGRWRLNVQKTGYVPFGAGASPPTIDISGGAVTVPDIRLDRGGVITGRVLDAKGRALSGMMVQGIQLVRLRDGTVRPATTGATTQTNDLGEFRLAGLLPGQVYVAAQTRPSGPLIGAPAPVASAVTYVTTYYPGFAEPSAASPVNVGRGMTTNGIEFSMRLVPAYQVSGVVVDSEGRAVAGAVIQLTEAGGLGPVSPLQAASANDGTFRVVNIPPGVYRALAAIPNIVRSGNVQSTTISFALPGVPPNPGVEIVVQADDVTGVRIPVIQR
jgi:protocatechuate 3,4-dioxygenase beta subunit